MVCSVTKVNRIEGFFREFGIFRVQNNTSHNMNQIERLQQLMEGYSDEELTQIVTQDRGEYDPTALQIAEETLNNRGIAFEIQEEQPIALEPLIEEIRYRFNSGELMDAIRVDFASRGLPWPIDTIETLAKKESEKATSAASSEKTTIGWGAAIGGILLLIGFFNLISGRIFAGVGLMVVGGSIMAYWKSN